MKISPRLVLTYNEQLFQADGWAVCTAISGQSWTDHHKMSRKHTSLFSCMWKFRFKILNALVYSNERLKFRSMVMVVRNCSSFKNISNMPRVGFIQ